MIGLYNDLLDAFQAFHKEGKPVKHINPSNISLYSKDFGIGKQWKVKVIGNE